MLDTFGLQTFKELVKLATAEMFGSVSVILKEQLTLGNYKILGGKSANEYLYSL